MGSGLSQDDVVVERGKQRRALARLVNAEQTVAGLDGGEVEQRLGGGTFEIPGFGRRRELDRD